MVHVNLEARIHGGCQLCLLKSQTRSDTCLTFQQTKLAAAMNPSLQVDAANAHFAGRTLASAAQSHPARIDANGCGVSPAGSAAAEGAADGITEEEQLPPANANPVINGLGCPPPSSLLTYMLRGKTDQSEVM